jgi:hypothetical protein
MNMTQKFKFSKLIIGLCLILSGSTIFTSHSYAQGSEEKPKYAPGREKHRNKTDEIGRKQGQWMYYNTFGEKILETEFVNDQKEGVERKFYGYDKVREETEYLGGVKEGAYTRYFFSSQVQIEGTYKDGKKDGKWTRYFEDGSIRQEGTYNLGKKNGVWKSYNRKGIVVSQATYKDGVNTDDLDAQKKREEEAKKAAEKKAGDKKGSVIVQPGKKDTLKAPTPIPPPVKK